jgi:homospermidine synthase
MLAWRRGQSRSCPPTSEKGALYLDTSIEPWPGGYSNPAVPAAARTNYALREEALALRKGLSDSPTAVLTHGANPGLVSHFVKRALLNVAAATGLAASPRETREGWAALSGSLGVRTIHIAERDTQVSTLRKQTNEFVNTWSVAGFISEAQQPCELGWGSHERHFPNDGKRHQTGSQAAIYLTRPGCAHARAYLDTACRAFPRLCHHAWRVDFDCRLPDSSPGWSGSLSTDGALCLSPLRRRAAVGA